MGLKCAHKIRELSQEGTLHLRDIHSQWRIDRKSFLDSNNSMNDRMMILMSSLKSFKIDITSGLWYKKKIVEDKILSFLMLILL